MARTKQTDKKSTRDRPAGKPGRPVQCPDCDKVFIAVRAMGRHRVIKHGRHASGEEARPETIARYVQHGKHSKKTPVPMPEVMTAVAAAGNPAYEMSELELAVASISTDLADVPSLPDVPLRPDKPLSRKELQTVLAGSALTNKPRKASVGAGGRVPAKRAAPADSAAPGPEGDPCVRKKSRPMKWCQSVRMAKQEYRRLGTPKPGPAAEHKRKPLTPNKLTKIIDHRPDMSVAVLTDYIADRYSMTPDIKRHTHNQILVARSMDRATRIWL